MTDSQQSTELRLRRAPVVRVYDVRDTTVILGRDGRAHELAGASALLARAVLAFALEPRSRVEMLDHVESLTGGPIEDPQVIDQLLALLQSAGVLVPERRGPPPSGLAQSSRSPVRLVLGLSGAIASALAPGLVGLLQQRGFEVRVVATEAALRFVQVEALEALVHVPVLSSLWPEDSGLPVPHINLAQWADVVLVCPASATTISRLATGYYSTLLSALTLSTRAPVVLVPSMNVDMYAQAAVQRNLQQLIADGFHVVHPGSGPELAHAPGGRQTMLGPMPPPRVILDLLDTVLRLARARRAPRGADEWDELYRSAGAQALPWHSEDLDADLLRALEREAPTPSSVLDVGTGLGVAAAAAAKLGHRVVATDISATALAQARERAGRATIVWLQDDITDSRLHGEFEVVIDRACLHLLPEDRLSSYAAALTRLTAPGGVVLLKAHDHSEGVSHGTKTYGAEEIGALFGVAFELVSEVPSSIPGPSVAPAARLFVLRRTGSTSPPPSSGAGA